VVASKYDLHIVQVLVEPDYAQHPQQSAADGIGKGNLTKAFWL
jgi:hypothetical protein